MGDNPKAVGQKKYLIMVKLVETLNRSTALSMFYIACCSVVLMHYNGWQIAEGGEYEVIIFNIAQMMMRSTTVQLTATSPLLAMCCYTLFFPLCP